MSDATPQPQDIEPPANFIAAVLRGGPHDGQHVNVPEDQQTVDLVEDGQRHTYHRFNDKPVFRHDDALARQFGGAA